MAFSRWGALRSVLIGGVAALSIHAAAAAQDTTINLQEQPLSDALRTVAQKTGESILFTPESVEGLKAPAISGTMNAQQAVSMLTVGTDLEVVSDGNNGLIVRRPIMRRAAEQAPSDTGGGAPVETVVVNGFKASLERALDKKREAANSKIRSWRKTSPNSPTSTCRNPFSACRAWRWPATRARVAKSPSAASRPSSPACASTAWKRSRPRARKT